MSEDEIKLRECLKFCFGLLEQVFEKNELQASSSFNMLTKVGRQLKTSMDEADLLRAEVDRLLAIEAAARAYCDLTPDRADETPAPLLFARLQAALAAKGGEK